MAKRKSVKKRAARKHTVKPRGFDFGCLPFTMAVASFDFPSHLSAAHVDGVAYGERHSDALKRIVPSISLVAKNAEPLKAAFQMFNAWSDATDPDAVEVTFVFRKAGGYVLAISTEFSRLVRRCLGYSRTHDPIVFAPTWFKPIDTVNPVLRRLREHCSTPVAPFLFDGVTYSGVLHSFDADSAVDFQPVPGLKPLLKFEVTFVDEQDVEPNTTASFALHIDTLPTQPKRRSTPPRPTPGAIAALRARTIRCHFPVTLERISRSQIDDLKRHWAAEGLRRWQIEQAICNLTLSDAIGANRHYSNLSARKADHAILQGLDARYELADGRSLPTFSLDDIQTQVLADAIVLLRHLGGKAPADLPGVQKALGRTGALEAPSAFSGVAAETATP